jgi:hypothetical protein
MLRAVFVRTLKTGVSYEQFIDAWVPEQFEQDYPATFSVSRNAADERQVLTILELDIGPSQFNQVVYSLTRPDALPRLTEIVESTELEGIFEHLIDIDDVKSGNFRADPTP